MATRRSFTMMLAIISAVLVAVLSAIAQTSATVPQSLRLYVFDNGLIKGVDPAAFQFKKGEVPADMAAASYLIVHPKGLLIWDTGVISDRLINAGVTEVNRGMYTAVAVKTLESQLAAIGYVPSDITYLGLSHYDDDHTANANQFASAIWLVQQPERDAMFAEKDSDRAPYEVLKSSKTRILHGEDYDVFGDGTVVVKAAYGHTPGHQVLYVKLARTGPVLLAGDLYHYQEERGTQKVPSFESNREQSLESRATMEAFIKKTGALLWIEHDLANFNKLKKAPDFYE